MLFDGIKNISFDPLPWQQQISSIYPNQPFSMEIQFFLGSLIVPAIVLGISVLMILSYQIAMCCRCCITCCCPTRCKCCFIQRRAFLEGDFKTRASYYKYTLIAFFTFWFIALVFTCLMILPYQNMYNGATATVDALGLISALFGIVILTGDVLLKSIASLTYSMEQNPCYTAYQATGATQNLLEASVHMTNAINQLLLPIRKIPGLINNVTYEIKYTINPVVTAIFWWYFGIMLIMLFLWLLIFYFKSKKYMTFMIATTEIVVLILIVIYCVELYVVRLNSSYCYPNPTVNTLNQFPSSGTSYPTLNYYMTCDGMFTI